MKEAWRILAGLAAGLALGAIWDAAAWPALPRAIEAADAIGGLWLDALKMTIVPLVFALIVSGVMSTANAAASGRITARSILLFAILLPAGAAFAAVVAPLLLTLWPIPPQSAAALVAAAPAAETMVEAAAGPYSFLRAFVAPNVIAAAAQGAMLAIAVFALLFGFAATRLGGERRAALAIFFDAVVETMLGIVGWVLVVGPIGVFALAFVVGARTGFDSLGAFGHYVAIVSLTLALLTLVTYPLAVWGGGVRLAAFARAMIPAQSVAIGTQSSLASLPAMIEAARGPLALPPRVVGITVAARRVAVPVDEPGGESRGCDLHRRPVRHRPVNLAAGRRGPRCRHRLGLGCRHRERRDVFPADGADLSRHGPANRADRAPDRRRDDPRHLPHHRQRDRRRRSHDGGRTQSGPVNLV